MKEIIISLLSIVGIATLCFGSVYIGFNIWESRRNRHREIVDLLKECRDLLRRLSTCTQNNSK